MPIKLLTEKEGWACVTCDGGCGRKVELRAKKIQPATFYVCDSREDGDKCFEATPKPPLGFCRAIIYGAAAHFTGLRHEPMSATDAAAALRAQEIWASGSARLAIEKAAGMKIEPK